MLSHLTAAAVDELIRLPDDTPMHVTTRQPRKSRTGIVVHRSTALTRADITIRHGLPITTIARTLLDIAEILPTREVERALDEALARKLVTLEEIRKTLDRTKNRSGVTILRQLIAWRTTSAGSRTKWQRMAYKVLARKLASSPSRTSGGSATSTTFSGAPHGATLEIDGYPWHSTKTNMERDRAKDLKVKQAGGDPNRVSNTHVENNILRGGGD